MNDSFSFGRIGRALDEAIALHAPFSEEEQLRALVSQRDAQKSPLAKQWEKNMECQPPEDICHCCGQLIRRSH